MTVVPLLRPFAIPAYDVELRDVRNLPTQAAIQEARQLVIAGMHNNVQLLLNRERPGVRLCHEPPRRRADLRPVVSWVVLRDRVPLGAFSAYDIQFVDFQGKIRWAGRPMPAIGGVGPFSPYKVWAIIMDELLARDVEDVNGNLYDLWRWILDDPDNEDKLWVPKTAQEAANLQEIRVHLENGSGIIDEEVRPGIGIGATWKEIHR